MGEPMEIHTAHPGCSCMIDRPSAKSSGLTIPQQMSFWRTYFGRKYGKYVGDKLFMYTDADKDKFDELPLHDKFTAMISSLYNATFAKDNSKPDLVAQKGLNSTPQPNHPEMQVCRKLTTSG